MSGGRMMWEIDGFGGYGQSSKGGIDGMTTETLGKY